MLQGSRVVHLVETDKYDLMRVFRRDYPELGEALGGCRDLDFAVYESEVRCRVCFLGSDFKQYVDNAGPDDPALQHLDRQVDSDLPCKVFDGKFVDVVTSTIQQGRRHFDSDTMLPGTRFWIDPQRWHSPSNGCDMGPHATEREAEVEIVHREGYYVDLKFDDGWLVPNIDVDELRTFERMWSPWENPTNET